MWPKKIDCVQVKILQGNGVNFPLQKTAWNHGTKNMSTTLTASLPAQWELRALRNLAAITLRYVLPSHRAFPWRLWGYVEITAFHLFLTSLQSLLGRNQSLWDVE